LPPKLIFRVHAVRRMFVRSITAAEVRIVIEQGETIERYPGDTPYPSRLLLGYARGRALHVVVADNGGADETIVVTVYQPEPALWQPGFRREAAAMKCVVCKQGETRPGKATVVLQRKGATVAINDVPARVCANCGEEYVDEQVAERVLAAAEASARAGVKVEIRDYVAA